MRPERGVYFETPARAERLQLLLHLVRNAIEPVYLRAPTGAGKRRLVSELVDRLGDHVSVATIDAGEPVKPIASLLRQLNLPPESADRWPQRLVDDLGDRQALVVVERADDLNDGTREPLAPLAAAGVRLLLLGEGAGADGWSVQFVDLPPFELAESAAFLRAQAGPASSRITDDVADAAHAASEGLPGLLLEALADLGVETAALDSGYQPREPEPADEEPTGVASAPDDLIDASVESAPPPVEAHDGSQRQPVRAPQPMDAEKVLRKQTVPLWAWAAGTVGAVVLLTVLVFQDAINALIDPASTAPELASQDSERANDADLAIPPLQPEVAAAAESVPPISLPEIAAVEPPPAQGDVASTVTADSALENDSAEPPAQPATGQAAEGMATDAVETDVDPLDAVLSDALAAEAKPSESSPVSPPLGSAEKSPQAPSETRSAEPSPVVRAAVPEEAAPPRVVEVPPTLATAEPSAPETSPVPKPQPTPKPVQAEEPAEVTPEPAAVQTAVEPASPQPAPVEDRTPPPGQPAPVEDRGTAASSVATAAPQAPTRAAQGGDAWLKSRSPERYTLQLVGARQRAALDKFVQDHNISQPYAVFTRQMGGSAWYSLVAGDYPDRDAAVAARARLPQSLSGTGVWPRTFGSISEAR